MAQLYDKAAISVEDQLVDDVGDWIDQYNLASMIIDAIHEEYGMATLEMAKHIARTLPDPANDE